MFKKYANKSSLNRKKSRIVQGGSATFDGSKIGWIERRSINSSNDPNETNYIITVENVNRIDKLAQFYYGSVELEWVILQYNDIVDISDLMIGDVIKIPSNGFVQSMILNKAAVL